MVSNGGIIRFARGIPFKKLESERIHWKINCVEKGEISALSCL